jgi:hypothetical protein
MDSSPRSSLTPLQRDLLDAFFARERRFFLTGGAALAGFYFGHRTTDDLDFFTLPGTDLEEVTCSRLWWKRATRRSSPSPHIPTSGVSWFGAAMNAA